MSVESPKEQWSGYKLAAYSNAPLTPEQQKECSECFYAGMMAGMTTTLDLFQAHHGARRSKEVIKFMKEIKLIALASNPTGEN